MKKFNVLSFILIVLGVVFIIASRYISIKYNQLIDLAGFIIILIGLCFIKIKKNYTILYGLLYIGLFIVNLCVEYSMLNKIKDGLTVPFYEFTFDNINYLTILLLLMYITIPLMLNIIKKSSCQLNTNK